MKDFEKLKKFNDFDNANNLAQEVQNLQELLEKAKELVKSFNEREILFGCPVPTDYAELDALIDEFQP